MCGIVGYIGPRNAIPLIISGLRKLEYRGYDSAGIAEICGDRIEITRAVGKLGNLEARLIDQDVGKVGKVGKVEKVQKVDKVTNVTNVQNITNLPNPPNSPNSPNLPNVGVGHTRWATHGGVTEENAHPHISMDGDVAIVHNGIVENFTELRRELQVEGVIFTSETDTEVIVHLIARYTKQGLNLETAANMAFKQLRGSQAIVVISTQEPDKMIATRIGNAGGVVVGLGDGESFVASDVPGILEHTRKMVFLDDGEVVVATRAGATFRKLNGEAIQKQVHTIAWDPVSAEKGEYRHFMQKEIFEQARALTDTIRGRVNFQTGAVHLEELNLKHVPSRIYSVACGTSKNSALVGKFLIEKIAQIPVEVDYGSEFRYRDPLILPDTVVLGITQSGETADTLAAMQSGRERGAQVWSIINAVGSQAERVSDGFIPMRTGPEIGVCSTKTFVASIVDQYLLACALGQETTDHGRRTTVRNAALDLAHLPNLVSRLLEANPVYEALANLYHDREHFLFLGRGINYPIALEGALKLKEVSYIHAEGYPAGEMKHGPIALIDEKMPVVCIAVRDHVYEKMLSQIEQVKARHGIVIAIATEGDEQMAKKADHVIWVPEAPEMLYPVLIAIHMQRMAYHFAIRRGCDVDQPRNLAKSVTVE